MRHKLLTLVLFIFSLAPIQSFAELDSDTLYQDAERLYLKNDLPGAQQLLSKFFNTTTPQNMRIEVRAHNLKGLIHFQQRNLPLAVQEFESAVRISSRSLAPTDSIFHLARYNLGNALFQIGKSNEALEHMAAVNPEALDADTRIRFHHLYGNVLVAKDHPLESVIQYLFAADITKDTAQRDTFILKAYNTSKKIFLKDAKSDIEQLSNLSLDSDTEAGLALKVLLARGYLYLGNSSTSEKLLNTMLGKASASHPLRARAEEMLNDIGKLSESDPNAVGVLLPLSGKFGKFGRLCLNAIQLALGTFEEMPERPGSKNIKLIIRDSGETNDSAKAAFDHLVKEEKVVAVLGPLLSKQFGVVARRAQEFGIPLFSLSQKMDSALLGNYIFPIALTPQQQIEVLVNQSIHINGYKRFAIMAPNDSFGDEYLTLFWNEVEKSGGEIVGIERYEPKSTDFKDELTRLLGLDALNARKYELDDLKRRENKFASTLKAKGRLRQRILKAFDPKAIVDFDAIFIPDDPATIGQIAPSFAVHDVNEIPMLGINTWNTSELVQRAGRYLQRSLFVDSFYPGSKNPLSIKFVQDYMKYFATIPGTIEVQAFDAASILFDTLQDGTVNGRVDLKNQLIKKEKYEGVSGYYRFTSDGVTRSAHLLTVKGNSILEIPFGQESK